MTQREPLPIAIKYGLVSAEGLEILVASIFFQFQSLRINMTVTSVGLEEVREAVDVALDELRESLRKVNQEVCMKGLHSALIFTSGCQNFND